MSRNLSQKRTLAKINETTVRVWQLLAFPKINEANSTSGETFSPYKKSGTFGAKDDLKDVECYKCHKNGHYANECLEIKGQGYEGAA